MDRLGGYFGSHETDDHLDDDMYDDGANDVPPSPVGQDERRMQVRAYNHWASLLRDGQMPLVADLHPDALEDFGPYSVLLDLTGGVDDAEIAFLGGELAAECGEEAIRSINEVPSRSVLSRITDHYLQILANRAPIGFEAEFRTDRGAEVQYRGILLPFSTDGETVDHVYGVVNWREVADSLTADELLLEIDQMLGVAEDHDYPAASVADNRLVDLGDEEQIEYAAAAGAEANADQPENIPEMEPSAMIESASRYDIHGSDYDDDEEEDAGASYSLSPLNLSPRANRAVDALGNPIGVPVSDESEWGDEQPADYDRGIKTAADYGLPDWDDEDEEDEDVEGLVDPLSGEVAETGSSSLMSMVSRGMRHKKSIDLSLDGALSAADYAGDDGAAEPDRAVYSVSPFGHEAYAADEGDHAASPAVGFDENAFASDGESHDDETGIFDLSEAEIAEDDTAADAAQDAGATPENEIGYLADEFSDDDEDDAFAGDEGEDTAPEGLYDALASARVLAQAALSNEDRSRKTLYAAVSQAYDFSLEAETDPDGYRELIAENGLTMQDRAPMTPIVKLVFGADYDKTRLTEYAAVLSFARREGVARGGLATFLRHAEGGVKGVVQAERKARREEQGKTVEETAGVRDALAKKLRVLEGIDMADVADGDSEFALVMVRRLKGGAIVVLGEVPEDIPLIEKAARKLLG